MVKYCDQDVRSLEEVYLALRPYMRNHTNLSVISNNVECPKCGCTDVIKDGLRYTGSGVFQKLRCKGCGSPLKTKLETEDQKKIMKAKDRITNA